MWKIKDIFEADYGCEERQAGEKLKVLAELVNETGEKRVIETDDEYLNENDLGVGSEWIFLN